MRIFQNFLESAPRDKAREKRDLVHEVLDELGAMNGGMTDLLQLVVATNKRIDRLAKRVQREVMGAAVGRWRSQPL